MIWIFFIIRAKKYPLKKRTMNYRKPWYSYWHAILTQKINNNSVRRKFIIVLKLSISFSLINSYSCVPLVLSFSFQLVFFVSLLRRYVTFSLQFTVYTSSYLLSLLIKNFLTTFLKLSTSTMQKVLDEDYGRPSWDESLKQKWFFTK